MKYTLQKHGFQKYKLDSKHAIQLQKIKKKIIKLSEKILKQKINLEKLHDFELKKDDFNTIKLKIINKINENENINNIFFNILKKNIISIFGPDIAAQKNVNLVIQRPFDPNYVTLHKDSPPNSSYEIVIWMPLVNCKNTNAFKFLPMKKSLRLEKMFLQRVSEKTCINYAEKNSVAMEANFGEFIIFWTRVYHYAGLNKEKITRWSVNLRYKNLFSPYGKKGYLDYFEPKSYSILTKMSLDLE